MLAAERHALPPIEKDYRLCDATGADLALIDLFGDHDTLITYFRMFGPERDTPCPMCTDTLAKLVAVNVG